MAVPERKAAPGKRISKGVGGGFLTARFGKTIAPLCFRIIVKAQKSLGKPYRQLA